ncbi:MAG: class I SAM-dependent methyltransferase [Bacteroidales bacterium]|nr:class I SAM-dependent methyltransferase [Bacteroidales bacterium]
MNYYDYINKIGFRFYKPQTNPKWFYRLSRLLRNFNVLLEVANTKIPVNEKAIKFRIGPLCDIPKMSTFAIGAMINFGVSNMPNGTCFVNVGVWNGFTFLAGMVGNAQKKCIGVDNFSQFNAPRDQFLKRFEKYKGSNHYFYDMDYIYYFSNIHTGLIGFYFYDGEHSYESQLKGLQIAEPFFSKDCIILVDDANWNEPREASLDFISSSTNNYDTLLDRTTFDNKHPTLWNGVMIFRKRG